MRITFHFDTENMPTLILGVPPELFPGLASFAQVMIEPFKHRRSSARPSQKTKTANVTDSSAPSNVGQARTYRRRSGWVLDSHSAADNRSKEHHPCSPAPPP